MDSSLASLAVKDKSAFSLTDQFMSEAPSEHSRLQSVPEVLREQEQDLPFCSTPSRQDREDFVSFIPPTQLPDWMAENHSYELSPSERQRQRDMSFGMRLPIDNVPEDEIGDIPNKSGFDDINFSADEFSDISLLDLDFDSVEPPSPIFKRDIVHPVVWTKNTGSDLNKTPPKRTKSVAPTLEPFLELSGCDFKNKLVQVISWTGGDNRKELLKLKISDGSSWIECTLAEPYRIYIVGNMIQENNLIKILEFSGSHLNGNLVLERIERSKLFQYNKEKIGIPVPLTTNADRVTLTRGIKRVRQNDDVVCRTLYNPIDTTCPDVFDLSVDTPTCSKTVSSVVPDTTSMCVTTPRSTTTTGLSNTTTNNTRCRATGIALKEVLDDRYIYLYYKTKL